MLHGRHSRYYCSISSFWLAHWISFDNRSSCRIYHRNIDTVLRLSVRCNANQPAVLIHASIVPLEVSKTLEDQFIDIGARHVIWVDLAGAGVIDLNHLPVVITVLWLGLFGSRVLGLRLGVLSWASGGLLSFVLKSFLLDCFNRCSSLRKLWFSHLRKLVFFYLSIENVPLHLLLEILLRELGLFLCFSLHFLQLFLLIFQYLGVLSRHFSFFLFGFLFGVPFRSLNLGLLLIS